MSKQKRTNRIYIYLTDEEKKLFTEAVKKSDFPYVATYLYIFVLKVIKGEMKL